MNPKDLPVVGVVSNPDKDFYGKYADLAGKNLLCIGFSEDELRDYVLKYSPKSISVLTKWADHVDAKINNYDLVIGDITEKTPFEENYFDGILTLSVLEHLSNLDSAFAEMSRIVRDTGEMLHMFGPTWSCAYGHHIYEDANEPLLNFSMWQMPAHMHLLCSKQEIIDYYNVGLGEKAAKSALHWFYDTPIINRVFFDDYMLIFQGSSLQLDQMELIYNKLPKDHLQRLRDSYPGRCDFSSYGAKCKLVNNK